MNQFKKAKQKALESGHQVENITYLQTAGVKANVEEKKAVEPPKETLTVPTPVPTPTPVTTPEPVVFVETPQQESANVAIVETPDIPDPEPVKVEAPVVESPVMTMPEPVYEEIEPEPVIQVQPTAQVSEPVVQVQPATPVPVPVRVAPTPAPIIQEVTYTAPAVTPAVTTSKPATAKKSVPNIFAPKNEAKSMRKSLVLKPTSVKIAENYCAKNGGSFNELIQTLLDNFIDEYGL